jgi:hypothetical protein
MNVIWEKETPVGEGGENFPKVRRRRGRLERKKEIKLSFKVHLVRLELPILLSTAVSQNKFT